MVHSSITLQSKSFRFLLALAGIFGLKIWTADITQTYLQTAEPLERYIYIANIVPKFKLRPEQCLRLLRPLYGLCDTGDLWQTTLYKHHRLGLKMKTFRLDPSLYYIMRDGVLSGVSGLYVDDLLRVRDKNFGGASELTNKKLDMAEEEYLPTYFTGFIL